MDWEAIEGIVYSEEDHPENILGPHKIRGGFLVTDLYTGSTRGYASTQKER